ncbi:MAG TPA: glycosyltransferase family 4 protein [Candidatus Nitrosotalea sp.]|nr:glycosyltransferase family 4 protein [Candidatus Nitrosotalea sp.]
MKRRLVILTEIISPYRIPLFNDLARHDRVDLHVIFLAETDPDLRQWKVYREEIKFSHEVLPSWRMRVAGQNVLLNRGLARALKATAPDTILCGGYNYLASWQALLWARTHNVRFLLWSESHAHELRRTRPLLELLKDEFFHRCDGFVVPGQMAKDYVRAHKIRESAIFTAPNAVDNGLFSAGAAVARKNATSQRRELNLPDRYFLFVGRLVREKGVFELLSAYATLREPLRREVGVVFAGDGMCRKEIELQAGAITPGTIRVAGFAHREQLAAYYALAETLILPTYTDTWGLVVNEAMACGLPVILSRTAGCAPDLVRENWNGLLVAPGDAVTLAAAMETLGSRPELCVTMGARSLERIAAFSPAQWSAGVVQAIGVDTGE